MGASDLFTGERFIPGAGDEKLGIEHYQRYQSVLELVRGKVVLDAACGEGYGSALMASVAERVTGLDIDPGTVARARESYGGQANLCFLQGSIAALPLEDGSVDAVISFETIEHVAQELQRRFLEEIARVLRAGGFLVMSTPNREVYSDRYGYQNEFHVKEFYREEFIAFLGQKFRFVKLYGQNFRVVSLISDGTEGAVTCHGFRQEDAGEEKYMIAVASDAEVPVRGVASVYLGDAGEYDRLMRRILELQEAEEERNQHIWKLDKEIASLLEARRAYEHEKGMYLYRLRKKLRRLRDILLPPDSRRRFFLRVAFHVLRRPGLMLHVINPKRIRHYWKYSRLEGMEGVRRRYAEAVDLERSYLEPLSKSDPGADILAADAGKGIEDYGKLVLPACAQPEVSILIPAYNQFGYTYRCVESILRNSGDVAYEVILADDCSADATREIGKVIKNIRVAVTEENLRFLQNCNHAAGYAGGKYLLFLNNDTQVRENWLRPLVALMERDAKIGMAGSKLLYPDGRLQEAGGIVWKDASAWNYGKGRNPEDPEFNYVKEVDYISGAAILIRRALWEEIGGFDERFAPAYYEDTDLAFEVRRRGYRVVYQPLSQVVHFEGVSNGTDVQAGLKQYQQVNFRKFYEKWRDVLEADQEANGENVFTARDRSGRRKHMLVVDHYVPHYDRDAGGKCTFMYLCAFVKMGLQVTFLGDNFFRHEPYATELAQMGIEVLYGNYYYRNWKRWLKEHGHCFDYVYLQRPHIAVKYMDLVKRCSRAKVFYFAHDLHHVREYRAYEMTKDPKKLASARKWKKIEYGLFGKADVGHVVGSFEQGIVQAAFPGKPIRNIPLYLYEKLPEDIGKDFARRRDLLYVGGFAHPPNTDAVLWFAKEVYPKVLERYPDMRWHVVGGNPPLEVQDLASEHILIEGFLPDGELEKRYRSCRMSVVPLRYGAGVKGKVVEAAYYQIPLLTTSIGAEGLSREEAFLRVEDTAEGFAEAICSLYGDYPKLREMSDNGVRFIEKYFTLAEAERVLRLDVDT